LPAPADSSHRIYSDIEEALKNSTHRIYSDNKEALKAAATKLALKTAGTKCILMNNAMTQLLSPLPFPYSQPLSQLRME
jgi:hypothetical protein